jgi:ankyrin repeat protein
MRECDPCFQDHDGYTPVHYAIERDDLEMLKALTTRFCSDIKLFSEEKITTIHNNCLKAISIRQKQGLTGFMLACYHQSIKCLNYLLELQINDVHLQVCI